MDENNQQQLQQNQQEQAQQPVQNGQTAMNGQQPMQNQQANTYGQQTAQNQQANTYGQQPMQNQQGYVYGQQPMQNQQSYTYGQQAAQNPQGYSYGQQPIQNPQGYAYGQQAAQDQQSYAYGQQPAQGQSPYVYGGVPVQPAPAEKKKKKTGPVIAIVLVAVIAVAIGIGVWVHASVSGSPEARLAKGFENLAKEMTAGETAVLADIDYPEIFEMLEEDGGTIGVSMNFTMPGEDTIGFDYTQNYDRDNELMDADMNISAYNVSLIEIKLAADESRLYLGIPRLFDDTYYVNMDTLAQEFNDSVWCEVLELGELDKDFALDLFPEPDEETEAVDGGALAKELKELTESVAIEKGDSREFTIGGKAVRCSGISVEIDKDVVNDLLDEMEEEIRRRLAENGEADVEFYGRLQSDIHLMFYLDSKDRIVCIETVEEIEIEDSEVESVTFSFVFSGKDRTLEEYEGTVTLAVLDDTVSVVLEGNTELTDAEYSSEWTMTLSDTSGDTGTISGDTVWDIKNREFETVFKVYDDNEELALEIKGGFEDVKKGQSATFRLGQLRILLNDEEICRFSGTLAVGPLTGRIEMPTDAVNFLKMDQADILGLVNEIYENIMNSSWEDPWGVSPL